MKQFIPCDVLKPYIRSLMVSESEQAQFYTVLPGTSLVMGFNTGASLPIDRRKPLSALQLLV